MHRKNNAAQEARQCKEKTKDQRHKTRLGPGPKPRPTQTEHTTKTKTELKTRTTKRNNIKAKTNMTIKSVKTANRPDIDESHAERRR